MRQGILFFILFQAFPVFSAIRKKQCDCYKYYTGKFYMIDPVSSDTLYITRTRTEQTEVIGKHKKTHNLIWLSNCKFIIRDKKEQSTSRKIVKSDAVSLIIETTGTYYKTKAWAKGKKKRIYTIYRL